MSNDHLAAIREAANKIYEAGVDKDCLSTCTVRDMQAIMTGNSIAILRLLDAAEKDSTCHIEPPDIDIGFYHCSNCACKISGGFRDGMFGETEWWNDPYCPGCGRRIVKEDNDE